MAEEYKGSSKRLTFDDEDKELKEFLGETVKDEPKVEVKDPEPELEPAVPPMNDHRKDAPVKEEVVKVEKSKEIHKESLEKLAEPEPTATEVKAAALKDDGETWVQPPEKEKPFDLMGELRKMIVPNAKDTDCKALVFYTTGAGLSRYIVLDVSPRVINDAWHLYKEHVPKASQGLFLQTVFDILSVKDRFMFDKVATVELR